MALGVVGSAGGFGTGVAAADPCRSPARTSPVPVGDGSTAPRWSTPSVARARPGIPWRDYTARAGSGYYPAASHDVIDYPAGAPFSWVPSMFLPAGNPPDKVTIGVAADDATDNLTKAIRSGNAPAAAVGLSQGNLGIDSVQARLGRTIPRRRRRTSCSSPASATRRATPASGKSFLRGLFPPGQLHPDHRLHDAEGSRRQDAVQHQQGVRRLRRSRRLPRPADQPGRRRQRHVRRRDRAHPVGVHHPGDRARRRTGGPSPTPRARRRRRT